MKITNLNFLALMVFSILVLGGCKEEITPDSDYATLKKKPYSSMSTSEKLTLQQGLSRRLKSDPDFIAANKIMNDQSIALRKAVFERKSKGLKRPVIDKKLSKNEQLKLQGIKDPIAFRKNNILMMIKMAAVLKKYPEFKQLNKETKKEILSQD